MKYAEDMPTYVFHLIEGPNDVLVSDECFNQGQRKQSVSGLAKI